MPVFFLQRLAVVFGAPPEHHLRRWGHAVALFGPGAHGAMRRQQPRLRGRTTGRCLDLSEEPWNSQGLRGPLLFGNLGGYQWGFWWCQALVQQKHRRHWLQPPRSPVHPTCIALCQPNDPATMAGRRGWEMLDLLLTLRYFAGFCSKSKPPSRCDCMKTLVLTV